MTIGESSINLTNDDGLQKILWQNYSFSETNGIVWINHTLDEAEQKDFVSSSRNFSVYAKASATKNGNGNVTIQEINYVWENGKIFEELQDLLVNVKVYDYTPLLRNATLIIDGNLLNSSASSAEKTGGWGEEFNFTIEVGDRFNRDVEVYAWHKKGANDYEEIGSYTCTSCSLYKQINFTYDYNGTDITAADGWTFKFNATNADGLREESGFTYTVEKDDIHSNYTEPTNNISINRSEATLFAIQINDTDNRTLPNGTKEAIGKIYISIFDCSCGLLFIAGTEHCTDISSKLIRYADIWIDIDAVSKRAVDIVQRRACK